MAISPQEFAIKLQPYAEKLCDLLKVPKKYTPVFVVQWAHESGYEKKTWVGHNNYAGITNGGPPNFLKYDTIDAFIDSQAWNLLELDWAYAPLLKAMQEGDKTVEQVLVMFGESPWDAGHYGVIEGLNPGALLLQRYDELQPFLIVTRETPPAPTWGTKECNYLLATCTILEKPSNLDAPVSFRWVITVLARILSRYIFKDGSF